MESMQLDAGMWSVDLKLNVGSSDSVYRPIIGREEREETRAKENPGTCHHMEVGPMAGMYSSSGPGT